MKIQKRNNGWYVFLRNPGPRGIKLFGPYGTNPTILRTYFDPIRFRKVTVLGVERAAKRTIPVIATGTTLTIQVPITLNVPGAEAATEELHVAETWNGIEERITPTVQYPTLYNNRGTNTWESLRCQSPALIITRSAAFTLAAYCSRNPHIPWFTVSVVSFVVAAFATNQLLGVIALVVLCAVWLWLFVTTGTKFGFYVPEGTITETEENYP